MQNNSFQYLHPVLKILIYIVIMIMGAAIFTSIGFLLSMLVLKIPFSEYNSVMSNINALIITQIFSAIGTFIVPAIVYAKIFENNTFDFLKIDKKPKLSIVIFTIILFVLANFVSDSLVKIMNLIPFESFNNDFIKTLLQAEENSQATLANFLNFTSPIKFIVVFIMMAILPGLGEELSFRGVFMNLFKQASNNNIVFSIVLSGFIFAVVHVQLHNFLAIFFMGIMLGTIYHLTGNLWVSIIAHSVNNGFIVVASYLNNIGYLQFDFTETEQMPLIMSISGTIVFILAFYSYTLFVRKQNK